MIVGLNHAYMPLLVIAHLSFGLHILYLLLVVQLFTCPGTLLKLHLVADNLCQYTLHVLTFLADSY